MSAVSEATWGRRRDDQFGPTGGCVRASPRPRREERRPDVPGWKDLAGTAVAALAVHVYVLNVQGWGYLAGNRWAAVTMLAVGAIGCPVGARIVGEPLSAPIVLLGLLGGAALVLAVLAIATAAQWALLGLTILMLALGAGIVMLALWAGATLRHAVMPPRLPAR